MRHIIKIDYTVNPPKIHLEEHSFSGLNEDGYTSCTGCGLKAKGLAEEMEKDAVFVFNKYKDGTMQFINKQKHER